MKIECDMNETEFDWWLNMHKKLKANGYTVERVYRSDEGITIQLGRILLGTQKTIFGTEGGL